MTQNNNEIEFLGNGQFEYVQDTHSREMLVNAWQAITSTELWDFVKQDTDTFMFSSDPRINIIGNKMVELGYGGHSGSSFGWTMRNMQYLARYGEEEFKKDFITE